MNQLIKKKYCYENQTHNSTNTHDTTHVHIKYIYIYALYTNVYTYIHTEI